MEKITPNQYIRLQKKLCTPALIITAHKLSTQWGIPPADACYRLLTDALMREYEKIKKENLL